jgi:endonuclease-3
MTNEILEKVLKIIRKAVRAWKVPVVGVLAEKAIDRPFETLIGTMLSLRTKDAVTEQASHQLFTRAKTPQHIARLEPKEIERLIFPVGFYRTKAANIRRTCQLLIERHEGKVPCDMEALLALPGVGRKTANLVLTIGHDDYGICVDTHVHRISNRWGYIRTRTPEKTEFALRKKLPRKHWKTYNDLLVTFGQNLCTPLSPWCSRCPVASFCARKGVRRAR